MTEDFGHFYSTGGGIHIDCWGAGPFLIHVDGKTFRFCDSDMNGPELCDRFGNERKNYCPGERSPFWRAYESWRRGNRAMAEDGVTCLWVEPKPTVIRKLDRKNAVIVADGEPGGEIVEE